MIDEVLMTHNMYRIRLINAKHSFPYLTRISKNSWVLRKCFEETCESLFWTFRKTGSQHDLWTEVDIHESKNIYADFIFEWLAWLKKA